MLLTRNDTGGTSNTIQDYNPSPSRSTDRYQEVAARARTVIERSRNLVRPLSDAFPSFSREQAVEDSDEAELSFDRYLVGLGEEDSIHQERRRRVTADNRYDVAGENDEDDDDPSHPDSVHELIQGLHNARGLLERGVETARSLSGSPSRYEPPNPPPARYRFHSRLHASCYDSVQQLVGVRRVPRNIAVPTPGRIFAPNCLIHVPTLTGLLETVQTLQV
ncbi:hypothetical protein DFJ58DRAFT_28068 [Suillus subalutaceus]|uniref:uncharacterized protein n=1 Tax=Suillus subalutaceus TaxID=48586 RepID=UPI001B86543E|nr:uncharacterized protein DFJ58DRAFT_28068 [Suillus subalutaceus]KAG1844537.1 hypothetical protein DFJ58DRAFT_28068 [Suillus subalutaceus]